MCELTHDVVATSALPGASSCMHPQYICRNSQLHCLLSKATAMHHSTVFADIACTHICKVSPSRSMLSVHKNVLAAMTCMMSMQQARTKVPNRRKQSLQEDHLWLWDGQLTRAMTARQAESVHKLCRALRAAALQVTSLARRLTNRGFTSFVAPIASMYSSPRLAMLPIKEAAAYQASSWSVLNSQYAARKPLCLCA